MKKNFIIIICLALITFILLGFYFNNLNIDKKESAAVNKLQSQSTSTEIESIEQDLKLTNLENIDSELADIENQLNTAN